DCSRAEIIEAQIALCHLHLKTLLLGDAIGMSDTLANDIADGASLKIDDHRAPAAELAATFIRNPTLGNFHHQIGALLAIRSDPTYRPHGMDLKIPKLSGFSINR